MLKCVPEQGGSVFLECVRGRERRGEEGRRSGEEILRERGSVCNEGEMGGAGKEGGRQERRGLPGRRGVAGEGERWRRMEGGREAEAEAWEGGARTEKWMIEALRFFKLYYYLV